MSARSSKGAVVDYLHPELVAPVAEAAVDSPVADALATTFGLLADPTRVRILQALVVAEELCVVDLSLVLGISQSAISHQLALLRGHRVVARRREGRVIFYRLVSGPVRRALLAALRDASR